MFNIQLQPQDDDEESTDDDDPLQPTDNAIRQELLSNVWLRGHGTLY